MENSDVAINFTAYSNEEEMIPKNSSVIVARIPVTNAAPRNGPKTLYVSKTYCLFGSCIFGIKKKLSFSVISKYYMY